VTTPESPDEERRKVFRQISWAFVYAPPILAAFIGVFGAAFLAFFVPVPNTNFWGRWALGVVVILVLPALAYWLKERGVGRKST
jgi:membrane-anchored protein YejM (alkaline phosphatase superfamily)